jgi:hypothetical protein
VRDRGLCQPPETAPQRTCSGQDGLSVRPPPDYGTRVTSSSRSHSASPACLSTSRACQTLLLPGRLPEPSRRPAPSAHSSSCKRPTHLKAPSDESPPTGVHAAAPGSSSGTGGFRTRGCCQRPLVIPLAGGSVSADSPLVTDRGTSILTTSQPHT